MEKIVRIAAQGAATANFSELSDFQGKLKELHRDDYERLRNMIVELGFSEPVSVWKHEGKLLILNGHQRLAAIRKMAEEGYEVPPLPISFVDAASYQEAKRKVLSLTSQYGRMSEQGLKDFLADTDISREELSANFRFPEIDVPKFIDAFMPLPPDPNDVAHAAPPAAPESPERTHSSGVRMVQLFFNDVTFEKFHGEVAALGQRWGIDNTTDIVAKAIASAAGDTNA